MVCVKKEVSQESKSDTNMNGWISIPSVIKEYKNGTVAKGEPHLLIKNKITDRIGQHKVLLPINQNYFIKLFS